MDKSRVKGILLNYLNDYYAEYPEELDSGEIANWGELESYYEDYPEIFQKLVNGDPDDPEVEELWNFAEKVWDAWTTFAKSSNALDESTTNKKIENRLAEAFEKTIKSLQKEGLFENVKSFNLDFTGKEIAESSQGTLKANGVSGSIRGLVANGLVEATNDSPKKYKITQQGIDLLG